MKKIFEPIPNNVLESICKAVGNVSQGISGSDINKILQECRIDNPTPEITKWRRMYNAFSKNQYTTGNANQILKFIQKSLHPSRFIILGSFFFSEVISTVNQPLSFIGLELGNDGVFRNIIKSKTITDAQIRAETLLHKLKARDIHSAVFKYCTAELLSENYFHAVFETTKGVADRLRILADLSTDGGELVGEAFSSANPILIINNFDSRTNKSEHKGFSNLLIGFFGMFRNTVGHELKINWLMTELDAIEIMTIASLCHRKLDKAHKIR